MDVISISLNVSVKEQEETGLQTEVAFQPWGGDKERYYIFPATQGWIIHL